MNYKDGFMGAVGNTPLIRLKGVSEETGCEIFGKAEFLNPSGSVKDRAAKAIVLAAEANGDIGPGGTVVEGTAGNTGIGLAHVCNARGYRCIIVIPETQSPEKLDLLRALGAEVRPVPAMPYKDPNNFQKIAGRLASEMDNTIWANQFDNLANREIHLQTTGPEIWRDTEGTIDAFVSASGTGGTIAGTSTFLKSKNPKVLTVLADPTGTATWHYVKHGEVKVVGGGSISEGIGSSRITANLEGASIDDAEMIPDQECVDMVYRLLYEEGLFLGSSSGINVAAAVRVATELGPNHTIVTILCDSGSRYQSRLFNPNWLREKGLETSKR
jgi:cysteine synthase A|tara:strand:+ start:879 stop:1862 length:984 start_codon:yes stop_codon:yes gene_type:complete